jgi:hypothetical protein
MKLGVAAYGARVTAAVFVDGKYCVARPVPSTSVVKKREKNRQYDTLLDSNENHSSSSEECYPEFTRTFPEYLAHLFDVD